MDKTSKVLMAAIAVGLFVNAAAVLVQPLPAQAQDMSNIETAITRMQRSLQNIETGICLNKRLC